MQKLGGLLMLIVLLVTCKGSDKVKSSKNSQSDSTKIMFSSYSYEEIPVYQEQTANEIIAMRIYFDGGARYYPKDSEGIEAMTLNNILRISQNSINLTGSVLENNTGLDYSVVSLKATQENFSQAFDNLFNTILNPVWIDSVFENVKKEMMHKALLKHTSPLEILRDISMNNFFKNHAYSNIPYGSTQSLLKLKLADVKKYYTTLIHKDRIRIVLTGNIPADLLASKLNNYLKSFSKEPLTVQDEVIQTYLKPSVTLFQDTSEMAFVRGMFLGPKAGTDEFLALQVGLSILNDKMNSELKQKGYVQTIETGLADFRNSFCTITYSTALPNPTAKVIYDLVHASLITGFTEVDLNDKKNVVLTRYYESLASSEGRASRMGHAAAQENYKTETEFEKKIKTMNLILINATYKKYLKNIQWYILGNTGKIGRGIFEKNF